MDTTHAPFFIKFMKSVEKNRKMLGKPFNLSLLPTCLINSIKYAYVYNLPNSVI